MTAIAPDPPLPPLFLPHGDFAWGPLRAQAIQAANVHYQQLVKMKSMSEEERNKLDLELQVAYYEQFEFPDSEDRPLYGIWTNVYCEFVAERLPKPWPKDTYWFLDMDAGVSFYCMLFQKDLSNTVALLQWHLRKTTLSYTGEAGPRALRHFLTRLPGFVIHELARVSAERVYISPASGAFLEAIRTYQQNQLDLAHANQANWMQKLIERGLPRSLIHFQIEPQLNGVRGPGQPPLLKAYERPEVRQAREQRYQEQHAREQASTTELVRKTPTGKRLG